MKKSGQNVLPWIVSIGAVLAAYAVTFGAMWIVRARFPNTDWGTISGVGQLALGLVLATYAILGYQVAITQFREQQARPELKLMWRNASGMDVESLSIEQPASGHRLEPLTCHCLLSLVNSGTAAQRWYMVGIYLPPEIYPERDHLQRAPYRPFSWNPIIGREGEVGEWKYHPELEPQFTFVSNGGWTAFPGWPLLLMAIDFSIQPERVYPDSLAVRYHIVGERMEPRDGVLKLCLVPPAASGERH